MCFEHVVIILQHIYILLFTPPRHIVGRDIAELCVTFWYYNSVNFVNNYCSLQRVLYTCSVPLSVCLQHQIYAIMFLSHTGVAAGTTQLHLVAKLDDLEMKLCDHENDFAEIKARG